MEGHHEIPVRSRAARRRSSTRDDIGGLQRARMIAAAVDTVEDLGYHRLTVGQIVARSRVSRKTFYDVFEDREDCFCAAFDRTIETAAGHLGQTIARGEDWRTTLRTALRQLLRLMDEHRGLARLCVVDALAASEAALRRRGRVVADLASFVERSFGSGEEQRAAEPLLATALVGGVAALIHERILTRPDLSLEALTGPAMYVLVGAYQGQAEAEGELTLAASVTTRAVSHPQERDSESFNGLKMRMTYRTLRVLEVIAMTPEATNREVAAGAGVADQGQISKLLTRLSGLGLIENRAESIGKGGPNAWHLTRLGANVLRTTHPLRNGGSAITAGARERS
jgi:AcrR family transcriptional regulator